MMGWTSTWTAAQLRQKHQDIHVNVLLVTVIRSQYGVCLASFVSSMNESQKPQIIYPTSVSFMSPWKIQRFYLV